MSADGGRRYRVACIARSANPELESLLSGSELSGFELVRDAYNGADALLPEQAAIDAVLLVVEAAGSADASRAWAAHRPPRRIPIVMLASTAETYFEALEAGLDCDSYVLAADLTRETLRRAVHLAIERKRSALEQVESVERYRRLYENSAAAIYELDLDGNLLSANPAMVELFGYAAEVELLRANAARSHFLDASDRREWFELLRREHRLVKYRKSMTTRSGRRLEVLDTTYLVRDAAGNPVGYQGTIIDFTEVHELGKKLAYETNHDSLTSLPNRRAFEYQLEETLDEARATSSMHALCYFDLDQFKIVNDTFGHVAGDELLRSLGAALAVRVSSADTLARIGGDEFALLLRNRDLEESALIANNLLEAIRGFRLRWGDRDIDVGASIGVVPIDAGTASLSELLGAADAACITAKEKGRNRVHVQEPDDKTMNRRITEMRLVVEAKHALQENRMRLFHQPIRAVPLGTADQIRFEILIRMLNWEGEIVPPGLFLPAIEKYNMSKTVDCWVTDRFLEWMAQTPKAVAKLAYGSINVSGLSLGDPDFLAHLCAQLDAHDIASDKICFEITETAAIQNFAAAQNFIATLRTRGCRFALDDFGSGTSSFGYLKNLPVDIIKIDGMFVRALRHSHTDRVIVKSINDVAHSMGLLTTAEFVEDADTLAIVTDIGVDFAQGYAVGMPQLLPIDEPSAADFATLDTPRTIAR